MSTSTVIEEQPRQEETTVGCCDSFSDHLKKNFSCVRDAGLTNDWTKDNKDCFDCIAGCCIELLCAVTCGLVCPMLCCPCIITVSSVQACNDSCRTRE